MKRGSHHDPVVDQPGGAKALGVHETNYVTLETIDSLPFIDPAFGVAIFAAASLLEDTPNRIGDLLDDGKVNQSVKG